MAFTAFRGMKPFSMLVFTAFIAMSVFLVLQAATAVVAIPFYGFNRVMGLVNGVDINDQATIGMLKFFQVSQSVSLFIVPSLLVAWLLFDHPWEVLCLDRAVSWYSGALVVLLVILANPFINFMSGLNNQLHLPEWLKGLETWMRNAEETAGNLTEAFLKVSSFWGLAFNIFMIAVLPAVGEELIFRGVIQKIMTDMTRSRHWGIWIAAAFFSALHMQFFGFFPRMILGALFGYLLVWSGSLWLPILAHFINNAFAVITMYFVDKGLINSSVEDFGSEPGNWYYALPSLILCSLILWIIRWHYQTIRKPGYHHQNEV